MNLYYAVATGLECALCTVIGIQAVNIHIARSGRQSIIAIALSAVIIIGLLSIPFHFYLKFLKEE